VKDSAQVRAIARHFACHDEQDGLAALMKGDPELTPEQRDVVVTEEGWVLGVTTLPARPRSLSRRRAKSASGPALADESRREVR